MKLVRMGFGLLLSLGLGQAALADSPRQFDLECQVTDYNFPKGTVDVVGHSVVSIRIDLDQGEWCASECKTIGHFARVTDSNIIFIAANISGDEFTTIINRQNGKIYQTAQLVGNSDYSTSLMGQCSLKPFSGFPSHLF